MSREYESTARQEEEAKLVESQARHFGSLLWALEGVPPPDFAVIHDEISDALRRAELYVFVQGPAGLREVRVRGPRRATELEARRDGCELLRAAFGTAQDGSADLPGTRARLRELLATEWRAEDLVGPDVQADVERRLPEFTTATQAEKLKEQQQEVKSLREWIYAKHEDAVENFEPLGPCWSKAGQSMAVPRLPGVWYSAAGIQRPCLTSLASAGFGKQSSAGPRAPSLANSMPNMTNRDSEWACGFVCLPVCFPS